MSSFFDQMIETIKNAPVNPSYLKQMQNQSEKMEYALAKQISTIKSVETNYGAIDLSDPQLNEAVKEAIEMVLKKQLKQLKKQMKYFE